MQWDSQRNNKRACWWKKREALLESFLFITEVSPRKERWWISFGSFVLCLSSNTEGCCSPRVWRTLRRNGRKPLIYCGKKRNRLRQERKSWLHLLINTFITFVPVLQSFRDMTCSSVNQWNAPLLKRTRSERSGISIPCISYALIVECRSLFFRLHIMMKE